MCELSAIGPSIHHPASRPKCAVYIKSSLDEAFYAADHDSSLDVCQVTPMVLIIFMLFLYKPLKRTTWQHSTSAIGYLEVRISDPWLVRSIWVLYFLFCELSMYMTKKRSLSRFVADNLNNSPWGCIYTKWRHKNWMLPYSSWSNTWCYFGPDDEIPDTDDYSACLRSTGNESIIYQLNENLSTN